MIVTNFSKYLVLDENDRIIKPPNQMVLDYADDILNLICFRSIETVETELFNSYEMKNYKVAAPIKYQVLNRKINIIRS